MQLLIREFRPTTQCAPIQDFLIEHRSFIRDISPTIESGPTCAFWFISADLCILETESVLTAFFIFKKDIRGTNLSVKVTKCLQSICATSIRFSVNICQNKRFGNSGGYCSGIIKSFRLMRRSSCYIYQHEFMYNDNFFLHSLMLCFSANPRLY